MKIRQGFVSNSSSSSFIISVAKSGLDEYVTIIRSLVNDEDTYYENPQFDFKISSIGWVIDNKYELFYLLNPSIDSYEDMAVEDIDEQIPDRLLNELKQGRILINVTASSEEEDFLSLLLYVNPDPVIWPPDTRFLG